MPFGESSRVAVSSLTMARKTSAAPPAAAGAVSRSVTRTKAAKGRTPERLRGLLEFARRLGEPRAQADEGAGQEEQHVGRDEHERPSGRSPGSSRMLTVTKARPTTMPGIELVT